MINMEMLTWLAMFVFLVMAAWFYTRYVTQRERANALDKQLVNITADKGELAELLQIAQKESSVLLQKIASLEAHQEANAKAQAAMKLEFQATAQKLFDDISQKFSTQSEKKIGDLLQPLQQRMTEFQKKVDDSFGAQGKETHSLKNEIEKIVKMNETMRLSTEGLTKALRGDVKAQGNWGEVILERILEASGLQEGIGYTLQGADMGLKSAGGTTAMPDVIVHLPDEKHVIIDSKVSLVAYERYSSETDEEQKALHLKTFLQSVRAHVKNLASKNYAGNVKLASPDFVLLFMPIEGAYSLAVQQDVQLHSDAWEQKVSIVCPSTLFVTLRTIASLWRIESQNRHAEEIAMQAGSLYDKFVGLLEDLGDVGKKMDAASKSYDSAMNKLSTGTGNLVGRVERIKKLGAKASKSIPKEHLLETDEN